MLNLNFNPIKLMTIDSLLNLVSLNLAATQMTHINMSKILSRSIEEIDLSLNTNVTYDVTVMQRLKRIKLESTKFEQMIYIVLNPNVISIDFSETSFLNDFSFLSSLIKLEELRLSQLNISSMDDIKIETFHMLKRLDLSHNSLTRVTFNSLANAKNLEVLDLSYNCILFIDERIFSTNDYLNNLRHLNLEHNQLSVLTSDMSKLKKLFTLRLSFNRLERFPILKMQVTHLFVDNVNS